MKIWIKIILFVVFLIALAIGSHTVMTLTLKEVTFMGIIRLVLILPIIGLILMYIQDSNSSNPRIYLHDVVPYVIGFGLVVTFWTEMYLAFKVVHANVLTVNMWFDAHDPIASGIGIFAVLCSFIAVGAYCDWYNSLKKSNWVTTRRW